MTIINISSLLIHGQEEEHKNLAWKFWGYLCGPLFVNRKRVRLVDGRQGANHVFTKTEEFFKEIKGEGVNQQVVVLYVGHGGNGYMSLNHQPLPYDEWSRLFPHGVDSVFINASCRSGSSIPAFRKIGLLPTHGLILAACRSSEDADAGQYLDNVISSFMNGEPYKERIIHVYGEPKPLVMHPMRSGKNIDYLLFTI